jgi:hypothetical protein
VSFTLGVVLLLFPLAASAQADDSAADPGDSESSAQEAPPDLVETTDGSIIRGIIIEKIVGDQVSIRSSTGRTYIFQWEQIVYAGPISEYKGDGDSPGAPPPQREERESEATEVEGEEVHFVVPDGAPKISVRRIIPREYSIFDPWRSTRSNWQTTQPRDPRPCETPCSLVMEQPEGEEFQVELVDKRSDAVRFTLDDYMNGDVSVRFHSRRGARLGLGISGAVVTATGLALGFTGIASEDPYSGFRGADTPEAQQSKLTSLQVASIVTLPVGLGLVLSSLFVDDSADVEYINVEPELDEDFAFPDIDEIREHAGEDVAAAD